MYKIFIKPFFAAIGIMLLFLCPARAQDTVLSADPDTVRTGIYITSIHNIDFKQKEFTLDLWLWLKYKNPKFDFLQNMEIPTAKSVTRSFSTIDTIGDTIYLLMKLQCVMKDEWRIDNFPFDHQNLRFSIENSQFDSSALVFVPDTLGGNFDKRLTLRKWRIDSIRISAGNRVYETAFGDPRIETPKSVYSSYKVKIVLTRNAMGLFWKMFLGMYIAFLIAYMCFYIHIDGIDSRFGLSVGALFAVVGNKYIVDSSLPESSTFTLVDTLHGLTLFFIFIIMAANAYVLLLTKQEKIAKARGFDNFFAVAMMAMYVLLNVYFIYTASQG